MKAEPKRRVLGKGLSSLIPDAPGLDDLADAPREAGGPVTAPVELSIDRVRANPKQPRERFDEDEIRSLADSIRQSGVLQPLLVRPEADGSFTLVAGERRLRAAQRAGLRSVPVIVRDVSDDHLLEYALIENLQRDDLGPIETARAFRSLVRDLGLTQSEVAQRLSLPRSTIANFLRLLDLPGEIQELISQSRLDMGHGRALAGLEDPAVQVRLARQAADGSWPVRAVEERVRRLNSGEAGRRADTETHGDPNVTAAERTLSRALGAVVKIQTTRAGRGRIELRFADLDDLDRLYRTLLKAAPGIATE